MECCPAPLEELDTAQVGKRSSGAFPAHTLIKLGEKRQGNRTEREIKQGKIISVGVRNGCDTLNRVGLRDRVAVVAFSSADVGPCPRISAFQQAIKQ